jgi:hypothetical protein
MEESLASLLDQARSASPGTRIEYRDRVAAHGSAAITALRPLLADAVMAGFAVRTIERAGVGGHGAEAIEALRSVPGDAPAHILADVDAALGRLGGRRLGTTLPTPARVPPGVDDDLYAFLVAAARQQRTVSYSAAGQVVGLSMRNPHHRRLLGQLLGAISEHEARHGRPMLSSIVVHKDSKRLGSGFYQLGEELHRKSSGEDEDAFAERELVRTFEHWAAPLSAPPGPSRTGAPDYRSRGPHEDPPPALGGCAFTGASGRCANPGRWDRDGLLACTTHALARQPEPWTG